MTALSLNEEVILKVLKSFTRGELEEFYWENNNTIFSELIDKYNLL